MDDPLNKINGKMVFAKSIFFPPNFFFAQKDFPFPKYKKKSFGREKNQLSKKGRSKINTQSNQNCAWHDLFLTVIFFSNLQDFQISNPSFKPFIFCWNYSLMQNGNFYYLKWVLPEYLDLINFMESLPIIQIDQTFPSTKKVTKKKS